MQMKHLILILVLCVSAAGTICAQTTPQTIIVAGAGVDISSVRNFHESTDRTTPAAHIWGVTPLSEKFLVYGNVAASPATIIARSGVVYGFAEIFEDGDYELSGYGIGTYSDLFKPRRWSAASGIEISNVNAIKMGHFWFNSSFHYRVTRHVWRNPQPFRFELTNLSSYISTGWTFGKAQVGAFFTTSWLGRDPEENRYDLSMMTGLTAKFNIK